MMGTCLVMDVLWLQLAILEVLQAIFTTAPKPVVLEFAVMPAMQFESPYCKQLLQNNNRGVHSSSFPLVFMPVLMSKSNLVPSSQL